MTSAPATALKPVDTRALIAVDLGAESCRVSLLRWMDGQPKITLVHRFANAPREVEGCLKWDLRMIGAGLDEGLRRCAAIAKEGVRSIAVDGWAVDYIRLDVEGEPLDDPFCYRDERTVEGERALHRTNRSKAAPRVDGSSVAPHQYAVSVVRRFVGRPVCSTMVESS